MALQEKQKYDNQIYPKHKTFGESGKSDTSQFSSNGIDIQRNVSGAVSHLMESTQIQSRLSVTYGSSASGTPRHPDDAVQIQCGAVVPQLDIVGASTLSGSQASSTVALADHGYRILRAALRTVLLRIDYAT